MNIIWLRRPGIASALTPRTGTVHEWITSVAVVINRTCVFKGKIKLLSVSSSRGSFIFKSVCDIIYESNSISGKSEYS